MCDPDWNKIDKPDKYSPLLKAYMETFKLPTIEAVAEFLITDILERVGENMSDELKNQIEKSVSQ